MKWFSLALSRYAVFSGRSQRAEFWYFLAVATVIQLGLFVVDISLGWVDVGNNFGWLSSVAGLILLLPSITVTTRRLHDIGKSGWWQLLALTGVGVLVLIYWCALNGQGGANSYGANPKEVARS